MLNFFETIIEYIQIAFTFVLTLIESLINAILTLSSSVAILFNLSGYVPFFISASMFSALALVVVNYIIGRSNN